MPQIVLRRFCSLHFGIGLLDIFQLSCIYGRMARKLQVAETVDDAIKALGGPRAMARLTGRTLQAVSNWKAAGRLPSWSYLTLSKKLEEAGYAASPELWGIKTPAGAQQ